MPQVILDDFIVSENRQLQVLGNPIRVRMLEHLCREPLTATQLGHLLDMAPARAHYHLRQLAEAGLAQLIETRESSGIMEKYYRAVARRFHLDKTVAYDPAGHEGARHGLQIQVRTAVEAFEQRLQEAGGADGVLPPEIVSGVLHLQLPPARYERMLARLRALLREFEAETPGAWPGTQAYSVLLLAYPERPAQPAAE